MWKLSCALASSIGLLGCTLRGLAPVLSLRAMTVLHDTAAARVMDPHGPRQEFALSAQLTLNPGVRDRARGRAELERDPNFFAEPIPCSDETLCSWANAAEQSVLAAMGVLP
jgi:hypothetical protein